MAISDDLRFAFDVQGYLHLRGALGPEEISEYQQWMNEVEGADVAALNADNAEVRALLNRPVWMAPLSALSKPSPKRGASFSSVRRSRSIRSKNRSR